MVIVVDLLNPDESEPCEKQEVQHQESQQRELPRPRLYIITIDGVVVEET